MGPTIVAVSDSPKVTSGFGNVSNQIYEGLYKISDLDVFGMLDYEPDVKRKLPYAFWPTSPMDPMGYADSIAVVKRVNPDIVWIMMDPGNLTRWTASLLTLKEQQNLKFKIFAYPPIEGRPVNSRYIETFNTILENGGEVVLWCKAAKDAVLEVGGPELDYIHFGADHADFKKYSEKDRKRLKYMVNLNDRFVIGSVGVNKRTKGYDKLIYTARVLKDMDKHHDIMFYCHTEPYRPTLQGYDLLRLAYTYDVEDMFLWKPVANIENGNDYYGVDRNSDLLEWIYDIRRPRTPEKRRDLFQKYDFVSRLNCFDMYLDTSQVEGWGMPVAESMMCSIPTVIPHDYFVRDEVFGPGCWQFDPIHEKYWDTWHTGSRLVGFDPEAIAKEVLIFKDSPKEFSNEIGNKGAEHIRNYMWDDTREKMNRKVLEFYGK